MYRIGHISYNNFNKVYSIFVHPSSKGISILDDSFVLGNLSRAAIADAGSLHSGFAFRIAGHLVVLF